VWSSSGSSSETNPNSGPVVPIFGPCPRKRPPKPKPPIGPFGKPLFTRSLISVFNPALDLVGLGLSQLLVGDGLSIPRRGVATSASMTLFEVDVLRFAMSAMLCPWRCRPSVGGRDPSAFATGSSDHGGEIRIRIRTTIEPPPGPWSPNLATLVHESLMRSLSALVIAAMTVLMSTFCCFGDVGDGRRAVAQLREQLAPWSG